ncbi:MAG: CPBP family intramembrane glutamic endopeptidase [Bacteroidota bacterium]
MRTLVIYVKDFLREDFEWPKYAAIIGFIAISITINFSLNFETNYINIKEVPDRYILNFLFYSFAYFGALALVRITTKERAKLSKRFFLLSITAIVIMAIDGSFRGTYDFAKLLIETRDKWFVGRLMSELKSFILVVLPLWVIWKFNQNGNFYGLTVKNVNIKPYLWLIALVVPIVLAAGQLDSFLEQYPMYTHTPFTGIEGWPDFVNAAIYEMSYGIAFLPVELLFRGFLVIGLGRLIGKEAVLPMVVAYVFLHFEKPLGEAISSAFGGYLLGIFALRTNNIWGGVIIHTGLAWLMELSAWLMKYWEAE